MKLDKKIRFKSGLFLLLLGIHAVVFSQSQEADRKRFKQAFDAASNGNVIKYQLLKPTLSSYPLYPYLLWAELDRNLSKADTQSVAQFLDQYSNLPVADNLRTKWLRSLARRDQWADFVANYRASRSAEMRCYLLRAEKALGKTPGYAPNNQDLWLKGQSQPKACDPLFRHWQKTGQLDTQAYWGRAVLAARDGNDSLMQFLRPQLDQAQQLRLDQWLSGLKRADLNAVGQWQDQAEEREILHAAMKRMARKYPETAIKRWPKIKPGFRWSQQQVDEIERDIAVFYAVEYPSDALDRLIALPDTAVNEQVMTWRARVAIYQADWSALVSQILSMNEDLQAEGRWRYWMARGLEATQRQSQADSIYRELAGESHFHGFLAADRLNVAYAMCPRAIVSPTDQHAQMKADPAIIRAVELRAVGLDRWARTEWQRTVSGASVDERYAAAQLANDMGWHHEAILLLAGLGQLKDYEKRFPLVWQKEIQTEANRHGLPQSLVWGIMRSESALATHAVSSANARGLMQLTLPTARRMAKMLNLSRPGGSDLFEPELNIRLGTGHLAELDNRFGHPLAVIAAYNAGPDAARKWLDGGFPLEADRWIETLPYYETRDYLPRVLAFTTIYDWRISGKMVRLSHRMPNLDQKNGFGKQSADIEPLCPQLNSGSTSTTISE